MTVGGLILTGICLLAATGISTFGVAERVHRVAGSEKTILHFFWRAVALLAAMAYQHLA